MPKLDFGKGSWPTLDEATSDGAVSAQMVDGYQDEQGVYFKRPGQTRLGSSSIALPVQGVFWSEEFQTFFAVGGGRIYKVSPAGIVTEMLGATVPTAVPASFSENGTHVYVTAGAKLVKTDGTTAVEETDTGAPTATTHVAWMDGHILCNESGSSRFYWTDASSEEFGAGNFADANADLDHIVALATGWRELILPGSRSTEIWYNSGETPATFQRLEGAFIERGCSAPYSICKADNTWFWLDHERAFVRLEGRNPKIISQPVSRQFRELSSVADLVASPFQWLQRRFILLSSASQGISWLYDYVLDAWYQWGLWSSQAATYAKWPIHSIAYSPELNQYLMLGDDGMFYSLSADGSDARFMLRSSHDSYGTFNYKFFNELSIRLKRGYAASGIDPVMWLRWRDQNGLWSNERQITLNRRGNYHNVARIQRLGRARTRQWEFAVTDDAPFGFVGAEVDISGGAR